MSGYFQRRGPDHAPIRIKGVCGECGSQITVTSAKRILAGATHKRWVLAACHCGACTGLFRLRKADVFELIRRHRIRLTNNLD
jgi:hypothetical protein